MPSQPVDVIKRSSRWAGQRWLLDAVIGLVGPEWDQGWVAYYGAFGPFLVTADEVPAGGSGLQLTTRLNGQIVQRADTSEMIYGVASVIAFLSEAMTFLPGDVLVMGTPPGVGLERDPQLFMKAGDVCEVEIEGIGLLSNPIHDEG